MTSTALTIQKQACVLLKLAVNQTINELGQWMAKTIDKQADEMYRVLCHDVDNCGDSKRFYEQEVPYRLEICIRNDLERFSEVISQTMNKSLIWTDAQLKQMVFPGLIFTGSINQNVNVNEPIYPLIKVTDMHRAKLFARASIFSVSIALVLSGVGIGIMVASMLGGTLAEELITKLGDKDKKLF